jgi:hypothetical protein
MLNKLQENQRVCIKLSRPAGQTLALTALFFALLSASLEIAARSAWVQQYVPFQAYGTNHVQFELQLQTLNNFVAQQGAPDCLIIGTSQSLRGINPTIFVRNYKREFGRDIRCYNFSVVGSNISTTLTFAKILVPQYHPKLLILGTSFLDYTEAREQRADARFEKNAWLDYKTGKFSVEGWLVEHSYAYRLVMLFSYSAPTGLSFDETLKELEKWKYLMPDGYGYSEDILDLEDMPVPSEIQSFLEEFGNFTVSPTNMASLQAILELGKQEHAQVVIAEMPYHSSLLVNEQGQPLPEREKIEQFIQQVNTQIAQIAALYHVPYWTSSRGQFPVLGWHDRYHLNITGSITFSRWLVKKLAQAVAEGQIVNPLP